MRLLVVGLVFLINAVHSSFAHAKDFDLEGVWVLNKSMTEQSLSDADVSLPPALARNLQDSYDALAYVFKGNRTTYTQKGTVDDQPNWYSWKIKSSSESSITINISGLNEDVNFSINGDCIGLLIEQYRYSEYYCFLHK